MQAKVSLTQWSTSDQQSWWLSIASSVSSDFAWARNLKPRLIRIDKKWKKLSWSRLMRLELKLLPLDEKKNAVWRKRKYSRMTIQRSNENGKKRKPNDWQRNECLKWKPSKFKVWNPSVSLPIFSSYDDVPYFKPNKTISFSNQSRIFEWSILLISICRENEIPSSMRKFIFIVVTTSIKENKSPPN